MGILNNKFDEIHCILNLERKDRIENTNRVFKEYEIDNVKYTYTFHKPIYNNIRNSYTELINDHYEKIYLKDKTIYNRGFDCSLNHYNIVKSAYKRGVNNLLVFEDDINFIVDKHLFSKIIQDIPKDYDIIKFYNFWDCDRINITTENNIEWTKDFTGREAYSSIMVGYSRKGMKEYFERIENNGLRVCDLYFQDFINEKNINVYCLSTYFIKPVLISYTDLGENSK